MSELNNRKAIPRCRIIGVLDDGKASLSEIALLHLAQADLIIGAERTLALFADVMSAQAIRRPLKGALTAVPEVIRAALADELRVVVLATGDPLMYGIAGYLAAHLCVDALEVIPNVSTIQLACARLGMPWQEMKLCSVHSQDAGEWQRGSDARHGMYLLLQQLRHVPRLAVLTSPQNSPDRIARMMLAEGMQDGWHIAVCEHLCLPDEHIHSELSVTEAAGMQFAEPNVMLLWRSEQKKETVIFGLPDTAYQQRQPEKGLITKQEVRAVSLARMQLRADSIVWDIGAGSGSVGLEAARLCSNGHVYAVEKNAADVEIAAANWRAAAVSNYSLIHSKAPEGLHDWPAPDAVFIGGSGGELAQLIRLCLEKMRPGGRLVMNFVTLENLAAATSVLNESGCEWDVLMLQAARSKPILDMHRMAAENPVWLVCASKEAPCSSDA